MLRYLFPCTLEILQRIVVEDFTRKVDPFLFEVSDDAVCKDHVYRPVLLIVDDISTYCRVLHNTFVADSVAGLVDRDQRGLFESP